MSFCSSLKSTKFLFGIAVLLLGLTFNWSVSAAASLKQKFDATQSLEINDNLRLVTVDPGSVWLFKFIPSYNAVYTDDLNIYDLRVGMNVQRSEDTRIMNDRNDPNADLNWQRLYSRGNVGVKLHYDRVTTMLSEVDDSGLVTEDSTRINRSLGLDWQHYLSEKMALGLNATASNVDFQGSALRPFETQSYTTTMTYFNTERLSTTLALGLINQQREDSDDSSSKSLTAGATYDYSGRVRIDLRAGMRKNSGSESGTGAIYDLGYKYTLEKGNLNLSYSRSINPSSALGLIETDRLRLSGSHDITELWTLTGGYSINKNKNINETEIKQADFAVLRKLSRDWRAKLFVSKRELDSDFGQADSKGIGLALIFNSPEF